MKPPYISDIRSHISGTLSGVLDCAIEPGRIRLPSREANASVRPPQGIDTAPALSASFGSLYGAPLLAGIREVNGWLLLDFSPAFFDALVQRINASIPLPPEDGGDYALNRMLALARHGGSGCPDHPAFHRALLLGIAAFESRAAAFRAAQAAVALFRAVPPRLRPELLSRSGALGSALARLLASAR